MRPESSEWVRRQRIIRKAKPPRLQAGGRVCAPTAAKVVLLIINDYASAPNGAHPSNVTIAEETCLTARQVQVVLAGLQAIGWLRIEGTRFRRRLVLDYEEIAGSIEEMEEESNRTSGPDEEPDEADLRSGLDDEQPDLRTPHADLRTCHPDLRTQQPDLRTPNDLDGPKRPNDDPPRGKAAGRGRDSPPKRVPRTRWREHLPPELDTPGFVEAFGEHYAARKNLLTPAGLREAFAKLVPHGAEAAEAATREALANGWAGIFPERGAPGGRDRKPLPKRDWKNL